MQHLKTIKRPKCKDVEYNKIKKKQFHLLNKSLQEELEPKFVATNLLDSKFIFVAQVGLSDVLNLRLVYFGGTNPQCTILTKFVQFLWATVIP